MTYHLDILAREGQHFIVKCPQYPAWTYRQHGRSDQLKERASDSLLDHVRAQASFMFWGWDGAT